MEPLYWPNHGGLPDPIHLAVLYCVLTIYWAQGPVLDAEEKEGKELAMQKVMVQRSQCKAYERVS